VTGGRYIGFYKIWLIRLQSHRPKGLKIQFLSLPLILLSSALKMRASKRRLVMRRRKELIASLSLMTYMQRLIVKLCSLAPQKLSGWKSFKRSANNYNTKRRYANRIKKFRSSL
jgi:hypothetical protein